MRATPQPSKHSMSIDSAAQILPNPEQYVDEGPCQETCSPVHPTETLLLLFLHSPEHTHLLQPPRGRGKRVFTGEGGALRSQGKGWKALLREWLLAWDTAWLATAAHNGCTTKHLISLSSPWTHLQQEVHPEPASAALSYLLRSAEEDQGSCYR